MSAPKPAAATQPTQPSAPANTVILDRALQGIQQ